MYCLLVGVSTHQEDHLKFLFEGHSDFCVLPTYAVIAAFTATAAISLPIDPTMVLLTPYYTISLPIDPTMVLLTLY